MTSDFSSFHRERCNNLLSWRQKIRSLGATRSSRTPSATPLQGLFPLNVPHDVLRIVVLKTGTMVSGEEMEINPRVITLGVS